MNDWGHSQFCSAYRGYDICDCMGGEPDRRLLISWDNAIASWGELEVLMRVKNGQMEPVASAGHMVGCGLWWVDEAVFAN